MHWWARTPSRGPNNLYVYKPQQNIGSGLCTRKTDLSPLPSNLLPNVQMRCFCCSLFLISVFIRFLFVFDVFGHFIWDSPVERAVVLVFRLCCFTQCHLNYVSFQFGVGGRMWVSIVSVSDHCFFIDCSKNNHLNIPKQFGWWLFGCVSAWNHSKKKQRFLERRQITRNVCNACSVFEIKTAVSGMHCLAFACGGYRNHVMKKQQLFMSYAKNKGTYQPPHVRSLISGFVVRCTDSIIAIIVYPKF